MSYIVNQLQKLTKSKLRLVITLAVFISVTVLLSLSHYATATTFNDPLVDAADLGDVGLVTKLLKQGQLPDSKGDFGTTALMRAAFRGNTDIIQMLIENGAYVNAADVGGETALHLAAKNGHEDAVRSLLYYGAYIDVPDKEQWTPLMRATISKQPDVAKVLIEKGADVSAVNSMNESVLVHAAIAGVPDIASMILNSPKASKLTSQQSEMAISLAKRKNHANVEKVIANFVPSPSKTPATPTLLADTKPLSAEPAIPEIKEQDKKYALGSNREIPVTPIIKSEKPIEPIEKIPPFDAKQLEVKPLDKNAVLPELKNEPALKIPEKLPNIAANGEKPLAIPAIVDPAKPALPSDNKNKLAEKPKNTALGDKPAEYKTGSIPISKALSDNVFFVQLGNFSNDHLAEAAWNKILAANNDLLAKFNPTIVEATLSSAPGDVVYRLRAGTIATKNDADRICEALRSRKQECFVVEVSNPAAVTTAEKSASNTTKQLATLPPSSAPIVPTPAKPATPAPAKMDASAGNYPKLSQTPTTPAPISQAPIDITPQQSIPATAATPQLMPWQSANTPVRKEWSLPPEVTAPNSPEMTVPDISAIASTPAITQAPVTQNSLPALTKPQANAIPAPSINTAPAPVISTAPAALPNIAAAAPVPSNNNFLENKEELRNEIQEMTRENFFRKQGVTPPKRSKKEYDDFYKQIENNPKDPSVSEAILVPDETYFAGNKQASSNMQKSFDDKSNWLNIYNLPDKAFADDYGMRMFKYDESLGDVQIMVNKATDNSGSYTMRVGPMLVDQAGKLCNTVRLGGYGCSVVGGSGLVQTSPANNSSTGAISANPAPVNNGKTQNYWINLGTFPNSSEAEYYWMFIKEDNNDLLGNLQYDASESSGSNAGSVKLKTGPFDIKQRATQLCNILRYRNIACLVMD